MLMTSLARPYARTPATESLRAPLTTPVAVEAIPDDSHDLRRDIKLLERGGEIGAETVAAGLLSAGECETLHEELMCVEGQIAAFSRRRVLGRPLRSTRTVPGRLGARPVPQLFPRSDPPGGSSEAAVPCDAWGRCRAIARAARIEAGSRLRAQRGE